MKTIKSISQVASNYTPNQANAPVEKRAVPQQAAMIINKLFFDLKVIFPAWRSAFPEESFEDNAKREWTKAFIENKIAHTSQVELALSKARAWGEPWFPSVGQFIKWCKPSLENYGLPTAEQAFRKVINGQKRSHPVLYATAQATGSRELKTMPHNDLLKLFTRNYEIICQKFIHGEDFSNVIPKALPEKVYVVTNQTQAVKNASGLRQILKKGVA